MNEEELLRVLRNKLYQLEGFAGGLPDGRWRNWICGFVDNIREILNKFEERQDNDNS
jgi:hypothetical protein